MPSRDNCTACSSGHYCASVGLAAPTGKCAAGFYCLRGVASRAPRIGTYEEGGIARGGDVCPKGTFCVNGTVVPEQCAAGSYSDAEGRSACTTCPSGFFCPSNSSEFKQHPCPAGYYCEAGTTHATQYPCPEVKPDRNFFLFSRSTRCRVDESVDFDSRWFHDRFVLSSFCCFQRVYGFIDDVS